MAGIEKQHNQKLDLTFYQTETGEAFLHGDVLSGPYRPARKGEKIPDQLLDVVFSDSAGNLLVPTRLFGP